MTSPVGIQLGCLILAAFVVTATAARPTATATVPAGFDCGKATRPIDRFICADAALRWQDLALSRIYRVARDASAGPARAALLAAQRDWLSERDRRCVGDRTFAELSVPSSELRDQAHACLMIVYLNRRRDLGDGITGPIATQAVAGIDLRPIARARPELVEDGQVRIAAMRLSPDGKHVAILLPSQEIDLPDQLWLYRAADRKLTPATPRPDTQERHPDDAVAAITALAWQGGTVFARVTLWGHRGDSEEGATAVYAATPEGSRRLREAPGDINGQFTSISAGLTIGEEEFPDDDAVIEPVRGNRAFLVWAADRGHGTIDLHMRPRSPSAAPYLVAWGGWELAQFLIDGSRSRLVYSADTGIALFDMATRGERRIAGTARGDQPYAVSANSGAIMWSTRNRCGDEFLSEPETNAPERFCLATMTGAARSSGR